MERRGVARARPPQPPSLCPALTLPSLPSLPPTHPPTHSELSDEALRPDFALPNVLDGLFALVKRLFDVDVLPADGDAPVWHPDVRFFKLSRAGSPAAYFYFDPYSRPAEKRSGAWMNEVVGRWVTPAKNDGSGKESVRLPVALMVCNQPPPVGAQPSLMTFRDVETVFHELVSERVKRRRNALERAHVRHHCPPPPPRLAQEKLTEHALCSLSLSLLPSLRATPCNTC